MQLASMSRLFLIDVFTVFSAYPVKRRRKTFLCLHIHEEYRHIYSNDPKDTSQYHEPTTSPIKPIYSNDHINTLQVSRTQPLVQLSLPFVRPITQVTYFLPYTSFFVQEPLVVDQRLLNIWYHNIIPLCSWNLFLYEYSAHIVTQLNNLSKKK